MKVEVSQKHIDAGGKGRALLCPIALALQDQGHKECWVWSGTIMFRLGNHTLSGVDMPNEAVRFIERFDHGLPVKPFTFELEEPDED